MIWKEKCIPVYRTEEKEAASSNFYPNANVTDKKNGGIKDFPDIAASSPAKYMQKHIPGWHDKGSFS